MKARSIVQVGLLAGIVLLFGCKEDEYELKFSHYLHVEDMGMDCSDCHGEPGKAFRPISHETCTDCHDEPESEKVSAETCGICHQEKELETFDGVEYTAPAASSNRHVFVHTEALAGKCSDCHGAVMGEKLKSVPLLGPAEVLAIRREAHQSAQDCAACHIGLARDKAPPSHDLVWQKRHGVFGSQPDASCSVCHTEDSCKQCHSTMQPASHNNMFRTRTHGVMAAWDRNTCMVCHDQDSCTSCHATTRPRSHNARWAAPGKKPSHCISCHTDTSPGQGCVVCHEGGNDLLLHESFWPSNHNTVPVAEIGCYQCHWLNTP